MGIFAPLFAPTCPFLIEQHEQDCKTCHYEKDYCGRLPSSFQQVTHALVRLVFFLQTSLPGVLPGTSGVRLPHRGHLPGVRSVAMTTAFFLRSLCMFIEFATRGRCQWGSSLHCKNTLLCPSKTGMFISTVC